MVDPRGLRFAAAVTTVVLAVTLITGSPWVLLAQLVIFLVGAVGGVRRAPYGLLFRYLIRPRLGPRPARSPTSRIDSVDPAGTLSPIRQEPRATTEDPGPPQFAQAVGAVFAAVGVIAFFVGIPVLGYVAAAFAFVAAFLNAAFEFCLGCQLYLFIVSTTTARGARA